MVRGMKARGLAATLGLMVCAGAAVAGPDVIVGDLPDFSNYGAGIFSVGTTSCNIGNQVLDWYSGTNQHPVISQNAYILRPVTVNAVTYYRFEQLGQAWLKHGFCSLQGNVCASCNGDGHGCDGLGTNCSDPYSSGLNGGQSGLGPKSEVNAFTGAFPYPWVNNGTGSGAAFKRLSIPTADIGVSGARYFVSSMYVQPQDAAAGNGLNNESYREVSLTTTTMSGLGTTQRMKPAIQAWKDIDSSVTYTNVDVPGEGRFIVASKATNLNNGTYHYQYAVMNLNSDRSGQAFTIPLPAGATVTNTTFRDVDYHSGEPYSNTDWTVAVSSTEVKWQGQTFATNANGNALRWDTMYAFGFDCNIAPGSGGATVTLFKPGSPATASGLAIIPGGGAIPPPSNDACAGAAVIGNGVTGFDTTGATTDGPVETLCNISGSNQIGQDIWFRYTATGTGTTTVSLCGSTYDTRVAVYGATCPSTTNTALACNDDNATACGSGSLQSQLTFTSTANQQYLIRVGGFNALFGAGTITITPPGPVAPENDACANAIQVAYPSSTAFSTVGATTDGPTESTCGTGNQNGNDIWYKVTPCASGTVTVSLCGATYDSILSIYPGSGSCPTAAGSMIACNDDSCNLQSQLTFTATAGTTYRIRVGGYQSATGSGTMVISGPSCPVVPANNDCAGRIGLGLGNQAFSTVNATTDGPATAQCGQINNEIWYNHPAQCTGRVTITTCSPTPSFDTKLAVYGQTGCVNVANRLIACNDNAGGGCSGGGSTVSFNVVQGRNYTIRVGGATAGATGTGTLNVSCVAHCRGDWDGNGVVDPADIALFVNDWLSSVTNGMLLADFDDSGTVDPADIASFVNQWLADLSGPCS